jgi:IS1 family transposase
LEGEAWVGVAFAREYRLMLSFWIAGQEPDVAEPLIARTEERLQEGTWPIWVSDGMDAYGDALKRRHCVLKLYPRTGKRGRPRRPKWVACPKLRYGQVVKERDERRRVTGVYKQSRYGKVPLYRITTVYIERHNLTLRQENRRLTRKTLGFSKKADGLWNQLFLHQGYFNFIRPHRGLRLQGSNPKPSQQKWVRRTPALAAGLTNHIWSLKEFMSQKIFINY